jgi:excisionase family DNA binding protein
MGRSRARAKSKPARGVKGSSTPQPCAPPRVPLTTAINELPALLTVDEFRKFTRLSRTAAYELVRAGGIKVVRFGRAIRIAREALES